MLTRFVLEIAEARALSKGQEVKSVEFVKQGAKVYHKA